MDDAFRGKLDVPGKVSTYDGLWRVLSERDMKARGDGALWTIVPDVEATRHARIGRVVMEFLEQHGVTTIEDLLGKENHQRVRRWRLLCRALVAVWEG
jgi:hypothetical protein